MTESSGDMRSFITGILRDMEGNALLSLSSGRTDPTKASPHGKLKVDINHWFAYPAELDLMVKFADEAMAKGRDAYISPIIYGDQPFLNKDGKVIVSDRAGRPLYSRSLKNALFSQTIYMDSDACPPEKFLLPPSRHVQTSAGHECKDCGKQAAHGHDYWFLPTPVPATVAAQVAHRITTAHKADGSDPSGWSANKVLRLPTVNTTYDELDPYVITWEDEDTDPVTGETGVPLVYDLSAFDELYGHIQVDEIREASGELPPVPKLEGLPDFEQLISQIPASARRLNDLIYKIPKGGADGWRSEQRFALLLDLKRFGFSDEETVAIAWHSPAASKWREDKRGVDGLWWELQVRAKPELALERGDNILADPKSTALRRRIEGPKLLTQEARARVEGRQDFFHLYLSYSTSKVQTPNLPYHTINAWTLMSLALAEVIELPKDPRPLGMNIFSITLGNSSTGKDESKSVLSRIVPHLYHDDNIEIPASSSREDLIGNLIERTDRISYIQENEADGLIESIFQGAGYQKGLEKYWTRGYDGEVPSLGRVGRKELNNPHAHAIPTMHFMGTRSGLREVLDKRMYYSGWLARQIWVLGDDIETTEDSLRTKIRRGGEARAYDAMPQFLGAYLARLRAQFRLSIPLEEKRAPLDPTDEAIRMVDEAKWKIHKHFETEHDVELWKPVLRRFGDILWKIAGLSAASDGRLILGTRDVEVALYHAESWLANALIMADEISDTHFSRSCDAIETFIASSPGQEIDLGAIFRFRKGERTDQTEGYLKSLISQGRIHPIDKTAKGVPGYAIKRPAKTTTDKEGGDE